MINWEVNCDKAEYFSFEIRGPFYQSPKEGNLFDWWSGTTKVARQTDRQTVRFHEFILWLIGYFFMKIVSNQKRNDLNLGIDRFNEIHKFGVFEMAFWINCSESSRSSYIRNSGLCKVSCLQNTQTTKAKQLTDLFQAKKSPCPKWKILRVHEN